MKSLFRADGSRLVRAYDSEQLWVEAWGPDSLRIRATHRPLMEADDWALLPAAPSQAQIVIGESGAQISNGRAVASFTDDGRVEVRHRDGRLLVAPVLDPQVSQRSVYLPAGTAWRDAWTGEGHDGGSSIVAPTPIDRIPVFVRADAVQTLF